MSRETDLERLERRVEKAKALVCLSEIKVEELIASVDEIEKFKPKIRLMGKRRLVQTVLKFEKSR
jgi:hypothetical protein